MDQRRSQEEINCLHGYHAMSWWKLSSFNGCCRNSKWFPWDLGGRSLLDAVKPWDQIVQVKFAVSNLVYAQSHVGVKHGLKNLTGWHIHTVLLKLSTHLHRSIQWRLKKKKNLCDPKILLHLAWCHDNCSIITGNGPVISAHLFTLHIIKIGLSFYAKCLSLFGGYKDPSSVSQLTID